MITNTTMNMCGTLGPYGIAVTSVRPSLRANRRARYVQYTLPISSCTPSAGRITPNTSAPGMLTTPRDSPESTSTLTRGLKPSPKKALVSPDTHQDSFIGGGVVSVVGALMTRPPEGPDRC